MEEKAALLEKQAELLTSTAEATSRAFDMQQQMETLRKEKAALEARLADVDDDEDDEEEAPTPQNTSTTPTTPAVPVGSSGGMHGGGYTGGRRRKGRR
jgi:hypothetical protein